MPAFRGKPPTMTATATPLQASSTSVVASTPARRPPTDKQCLSRRQNKSQRLQSCHRPASISHAQVLFFFATATAFPSACGGLHTVLPCMAWFATVCKASAPTVNKRQCSINELHFHAVQGLGGRRDVQEVQDDGLVGPQHGAAGHLDRQAVANLACHVRVSACQCKTGRQTCM